jgi:hypothetical protein
MDTSWFWVARAFKKLAREEIPFEERNAYMRVYCGKWVTRVAIMSSLPMSGHCCYRCGLDTCLHACYI